MSYILDALRKSEQQRQQGAAPITRLTLATEPMPKRRMAYSNGVLAIALVGAGALIGWLRPWQSDSQVTTADPVAAAASEPSVPGTPGVRPAVPVARMPVPMERQSQDRIAAVLPPPAQTAQATPPQDIPAAKPESPPADPAPQTAPMTLAQLPDPVRQEIPVMTISLHSYSDVAKESMVMINGILLHVGDDIAPGFSLEQITPDGVVIGYKGYRFRRALHQ